MADVRNQSDCSIENPRSEMQVEPVSVYTKFLVNARCKYETEAQAGISQYCPGYADAKRTPFEGPKSTKLRKMSDVFCSRCRVEDDTCRQLFCPPNYMIVEVAMSLIEHLCSALSTEDLLCHRAYCESEMTKRSLNTEAGKQNVESNIVCKAAVDWSNTAGMDDWCANSCPSGNDDTCLVTYCECWSEEEITPSTTVSSSSISDCSDWQASPTYSQVMGMTAWCRTVCRTGACPHSHCQCATKDKTTTQSSTAPSTPKDTPTYSSLTPSSSALPTTTSGKDNLTVSGPDSSTTTSASSASASATGNSVSLSRSTATSQGSTISSRHTMTATSTLSSESSTVASITSTTEPSTYSFEPTSTSTIASFPSTPTLSTSESPGLPDVPSRPTDQSSTHRTSLSTESESTSGISSSLSTSSPKTESSTSKSSTPVSSSTTSFMSTSTSENSPTSHLTTSTEPVTTVGNQVVNETDRLLGGFNTMKNVICTHTSELRQTAITDRLCRSGTQDDDLKNKGYTVDIIDRVLKFAPNLMCSLMSRDDDNKCSRLFCGKSPLLEEAIKSSMCSVCRQFENTVGRGCSLAYCTA